VAFTHLHLDHTAELAPLLFALRNAGIGRACMVPGWKRKTIPYWLRR
jgi:ribonuclease BN (tRNA processing enzyme)